MDWDLEVLNLLRENGAGWVADRVPWEALVDRYQALPWPQREALAERLLAMLSLDYRNPHSEPPDPDEPGPGLPAGMRPEDLLCVEAAAYAAAALGLPGAAERLQAILRAPRFHAVYPYLRRLHLDLPDLVRRLRQDPAAGG